MAKRGVSFADDTAFNDGRKGSGLSGTALTCVFVGAFVLLVLMPALIGPPDDDPQTAHTNAAGFQVPHTGHQPRPTLIPRHHQNSGSSRRRRSAFLRPLPPHLALERFDQDGDTRLTGEELSAACSVIVEELETTWDCANASFDGGNRYDDNNNDQLERSEWMALVRDHYLEDASTRISLYSMFLYPVVLACLLVVAGVLASSPTVLQSVLGAALPALFLVDWFLLTDGLIRACMAFLVQLPVAVTTVVLVSRLVFRGGPVPRRLQPTDKVAAPPAIADKDDGDKVALTSGDDQPTPEGDASDQPESKATPEEAAAGAATSSPSSPPKGAAFGVLEPVLRSTIRVSLFLAQFLRLSWMAATSLALWCTAKRRGRK